MSRLPPALLIGSGLAALGYQVVWVRFLTLTLGATTEAVSTVLAAFFLGLAAGSAAAPRIAGRRSPLRTFAVLEAGIGALGATLALVLPALPALAGALPVDSIAGRFGAALLLLLPPTALMGATFPVLAASAAAGSPDPRREIGRLYAANTVGAAAGAALAGFALIPALGLDGTAFALAGLNALVAATAWSAAGRGPRPAGARAAAPPSPSPATASGALPGDRAAALGVLVVTGCVSLATEVAWTKVLVLFTGATVYGFATILTVFLAGLALGAAAARRLRVPPGGARPRLAVVLLALGFALLATRAGFTLLPAAFDLVRAAPLFAAVRLALHFAVVAALLLPSTLLLGACFPLALSVWCGGAPHARLGPAYAANTVAGVAGSVAAGFWWIPAAGSDAVLAGCAATVLLAPLALLRGLPSGPRAGLAGLAVAGLLLAAFGPRLRFEPLIAAVRYEYDAESGKTPRFLDLREGRTGVISAVTYDDGKTARIQSNGLNESVISLEAPYLGSRTETLLALVPWALHDDPRRTFVVGYGGGVTIRALLAAGAPSVRCVELEPAILETVHAVLGPAARLGDPRLDLRTGDARHDLLLEPDRYDVIISQPSHPWRSGESALFTREFFELVRSRLQKDGLFAQWLNLFNMDVPTLGSLVRTFFDAFPSGFVLALPRSGDLILIGAPDRLRVAPGDFKRSLSEPDLAGLLAACRLEKPIDILAYWAWSRADAIRWAAGRPPNTDRNILSEVRLAALRLRPEALPTADDPYVLLRRTTAFDLATVFGPADSPGLYRELATRFVRRDQRPRARMILPRLAAFDPDLADSLSRRLDRSSRPVADVVPGSR